MGVVALQLRAGARARAVRDVQGVGSRGSPAAGPEAREPRLRRRHQVLARVQPARRARRDLGERARGLHRTCAKARPQGGAGLCRAARRAGLPLDQGRGRACALAGAARGGGVEGSRQGGEAEARSARCGSHAMSTRELLFEIGVEELPAGYVPPALEQLARGVQEGLAALRLECGGVETYGTPRRLTVLVHRVSPKQTEFDEEAMGPAAKVAFDAQGQPTRALLGFCAGKGVNVSDVRRVDTPKGEYVAVTVHHAGKSAADVLPAMLADVALKLQFPKTMRWDAGDYR